ncbi:MAG: hypothetical protein Q8928_07640 [Bacteroidota bacterium]|nr:hypothetical protein [Bacteroidota bacterium]
MKTIIVVLIFISSFVVSSLAAEWQWSAEVKSVISGETNDHPRAFLWIPANCKQVRGVVFGQHNMIEEGILEHASFRKTMTDLGFAEIWVTPGLNFIFDFNNGAGEQFTDMVKALAEVSGYSELEFAPVVPIGHSACASYPWNFGAWNPARTLAILSIHGDAPLTNLTGSGRPNPDWGNRNIDGVPSLMVEGEYEWWEARVKPAFDFQARFPKASVSFLCDAGRGHFDFSDGLVDYLALFIKKAAQYRLPKHMPLDKPATLNPVYPQSGWIADRWRKDENPYATAAPYAKFSGVRKASFWYFDKEMTDATEKYYATVRGKKDQYIGFSQNNKLLSFNQKLHARIVANFKPESDGLTFHVAPVFTDTLRIKAVNEHVKGTPTVTRICGPVEKINDTTFSVRFYRMGFNNPKRTGDIWLLGQSNGDAEYKSSVQQLNIRIPLANKDGQDQKITFDSIPNQKFGIQKLKLSAISNAQMPVYFYVQEGPAEIRNGELVFAKIPPRAKYPVKVTVVAWQYGRSIEPKVKSAQPVVRSFYIVR